MEIMKLVEIIWCDACLEEAHIPATSLPNLRALIRKNVGYCIEDNDEQVQISFGIIENLYKGDRAYDMVLTLPKPMIKEIKELG